MSPVNLSSDVLIELLNWRYATKAFDPDKKIPAETWAALEQSLVLSPSSFGLQPWKFFVVAAPETRQKLLPASWGQNQIVDASHLVVLAINTGLDKADVDRFMARTADVRDVPLESLEGFSNVIKGFMDKVENLNDWSTRQVYIALEQLMLSAALMGIDTCPIEGFSPEQYDDILGLTDRGYHAVVVCAAGYRSPEDKYAQLPKVRYPLEEVVEHL